VIEEHLRALGAASDLEAHAASLIQRWHDESSLEDRLGGLVLGRPFRTVSTGEVFDRVTGDRRGRPVTERDLLDAVAVFEAGEVPNLDFGHRETEPIGRVLAMWTVDDGDRTSLAVLPAYTRIGARLVGAGEGTFWSSPHLVWADYHHPRSGDTLGGFWIAAVAVTERPAQAHEILDSVALSQAGGRDVSEIMGPASRLPEQEVKMDAEEIQAIKDENEALRAEVAELRRKLDEAAELAAAEDDGDAVEGDEEEPMDDGTREALSALTERHAALAERHATLAAELAESKRTRDVEALLSRGAIDGDEVPTVVKAWDAEEAAGSDAAFKPFSEVYASRPDGFAVPVGAPRGHGNAPSETQTGRADGAIRELMSSQKVSYQVAACRLYSKDPGLFQ